MKNALKKIALILFGTALALALLETGLRIAGYLANSAQNEAARNGVDFGNKNQYRILCLGESTTAEIFINGKGASWPMQMEIALNAQEKGPRRFKTINQGVPGTVTAFMLANLKDQLEQYRPQLVVTMMGINDRSSIITYDEKPMGKMTMFLSSFRVVKFFRVFTNAARHGFRKEEGPPPTPIPYINEPELVGALHEATMALNTQECLRIFEELKKKHPNEILAVYAIFSNTLLNAIRGGLWLSDDLRNEAFRVFNKVIELEKPTGNLAGNAYVGLSFLYVRNNEWEQYFHACKMAIKYLSNKDDRAYHISNYIRFAKEQKRKDPYVDELVEKNSMSIAGEGRYTATRNHYKKFYAILKEREIAYAAMQYPTRDVRLLKYFFSNDRDPAIDNGDDYYFSTKPDGKYDSVLKDDPNITFISNEESFNKALSIHPYEYYFVDNFGGSFGHTTVQGHELIGTTAADALRKSGILDR